MKVAHKRLLPLLAVAIIAVTLVWRFYPAQLNITEDWWIVYNTQDDYDTKTAQILASKYGCQLKSIHAMSSMELNMEGLNLLFIGGSDALAGKAPWINPQRPGLTIARPDTQPDVYYYHPEADWANVYIRTPKRDYYVQKNGEFLHDYGLITKAYDGNYQRYVVIAIGWSAQGTMAGAKLLMQDLDVVRSNSWIVYEITEGMATPLTEWNTENFEYGIVGSG